MRMLSPLLCEYEGECCHLVEFKVEWIVDFGTSYHCDLERKNFTTYKIGSLGSINIGNDNTF